MASQFKSVLRETRANLLVLIVFVLAGATSLFGGFDRPASGPDQGKNYDGEVVGGAGRNPPGTIAKLMTKFGITEQAAKDKLVAIRANIQKAIDAVKLQDAALGNCLQDALNCERICIDFAANTANAAAIPDGTTACNKDTINIGVDNVGCTALALNDAAIYQLFTSLLHEAKHMAQSYDPGPLDENADKAKVQRRKKDACNEIEAEQLENMVIDALIPVLEQLAMGQNPATPAGAAGAFVDAIKMLPAGQPRMDAAMELLRKIKRIKRGNDSHIQCEQDKKAAFDTFLASAATPADLMALNNALKETKWYKDGRRGQFDIVEDPVYFGGGGQPTFTQYDGDVEEVVFTGLMRVTDLRVLPSLDKLIVAGTNFANQGVLLGYSDPDEDGFFNFSSQQTLLTSSLLQGGLVICSMPQPSQILILSSGNNQVFRVVDMISDGFPETLVPTPVASSPLLSDVISLRSSPDGSVLYGYRFVPVDDHLLNPTDSTLALIDTDLNGSYETVQDQNNFMTAAFNPNFVVPPVDGAETAVVFAAHLAALSVHLVDAEENSLGIIGIGAAGPDGNAVVNLSSPFTLGTLVQVRDDSRGINSVGVPVTSGIPTVSGWGVIILALGISTLGTLVLRNRVITIVGG